MATNIREPPSIEKIRRVVQYNPQTGIFIRIGGDNPRAKIGKPAGVMAPQGYLKICINGFDYMAHRLAWFCTHGEWPEEIDHINRIRHDNRIVNLRAASKSENRCNRPCLNESRGIPRGVSWDKRCKHWYVRIHWRGKAKHLGSFNDLKLAAAAYDKAAREVHGAFATLNTGV